LVSADVAIVGGGPAGIVAALELARAGVQVVVIESGGKRFSPRTQRLADAATLDPQRHAPMSMATRRQLGGASVIWGGRCVPYDPIDFEDREVVAGSEWPVGYDDLVPYFQRACNWLCCGRAAFDGRELSHLPASIVPGLPDGEVRTSTFERWSLPTNFGSEYLALLRRSESLRLITGLTCTQVVCGREARRISHLEARAGDGRPIRIRARRYVLACGGLETTRLLLASQDPGGYAVGDHSGHLGRWYMGHAEGIVARVHFTTPPRATVFGYERDVDGVYIRRRFSFTGAAQKRLGLPNIVAWLSNPLLPDPAHGSGVLSFAYLALRSPLGGMFAPDAQRMSLTGHSVPGAPYGPVDPGPVRDHLRNLIREPGPTARFIADFGTGRFYPRRRRAPGFFVYSPSNTYPLQYHGEQLPNWESRVTLAQARDVLGMPRLNIDVRFSEKDVNGVVRAHRVWDEYLRQHGRGRIEYLYDDVERAVEDHLGAGFHQVGTTRMSARSQDGVLTRDLAVHGFDDLFVVSSSALVTSGQANSTFMIVVLALRLADRLRQELGTRKVAAEVLMAEKPVDNESPRNPVRDQAPLTLQRQAGESES
jgi:choline dehydrogenase-like flavoprotein